MSVPRWELEYGWDGPLFHSRVGDHTAELADHAIVVLARDYDSLREAYDRLKAENEELKVRLRLAALQERRTAESNDG